MVNCPYCSADVIDDINFCIECENQVRCLNCGSILYKGKSRCLKCGESLKETATPVSEMNSYTLKRKVTRHSSSEEIEVKASDAAVGALMGKLPFGANTPLQPLNLKEIPSTPPALPSERERTISLESKASVDEEDKFEEKSLHVLTASSLFNKLSDDEIAPSKVLKDYIQNLSSKKEMQQVLTTMLVWAHKELNGENINREKLLTAIKRESLFNSAFYTYLLELAKNYFITVSDRYKINSNDGERRVQEIMQEIQNPATANAASEQKKTGRRGRPSGSLNKEEVKVVEPWLSEPLPKELEKFDARQLSSAADWGAFGLYVLTKVLNVAQSVDAGLVYVYLTKQFEVMTVSRKAFVKRMGDTTNRFKKNANGAYFLTAEAEAQIKGLIEKASNS